MFAFSLSRDLRRAASSALISAGRAGGAAGAAATPGKVTLKANGALTVDNTLLVSQPGTSASLPTGVPYPTGTPVPGIQATGGGIFTGGGNLNIEALDLSLGASLPNYNFYYATGPTANTGYNGQILGPQLGAALNTFSPVLSAATGGAVYDFGNRVRVSAGNPASGQISGSGG